MTTTGKSVEESKLIHEDDLPEDMTQTEYDAWFETSYVPGGVGCRVGYWPLPGKSVEEMAREINCECGDEIRWSDYSTREHEDWVGYRCRGCGKLFTGQEIRAKYAELKGEGDE